MYPFAQYCIIKIVAINSVKLGLFHAMIKQANIAKQFAMRKINNQNEFANSSHINNVASIIPIDTTVQTYLSRVMLTFCYSAINSR